MTYQILDEECVSKRWSVSSAIIIHVPAKKVWEIISAPGNLTKTHPFVKEHTTLKWPGPNSLDQLTYHNGYRLYRCMRRWNEGQGYVLDASLGENKVSRVIWKIEEVAQDQSLFSITILPFHVDQLPSFVSWVPFYLKVYPILKSYLNSVVTGHKYYLETGTVVTKNQFGAHKYFSP